MIFLILICCILFAYVILYTLRITLSYYIYKDSLNTLIVTHNKKVTYLYQELKNKTIINYLLNKDVDFKDILEKVNIRLIKLPSFIKFNDHIDILEYNIKYDLFDLQSSKLRQFLKNNIQGEKINRKELKYILKNIKKLKDINKKIEKQQLLIEYKNTNLEQNRLNDLNEQKLKIENNLNHYLNRLKSLKDVM